MTQLARFRDWLGLDGAQRRHPRYLELIVASSGKSAFSLRINVYTLHWGLATAALLAMLWVATLMWAAWYHYSSRAALSHMSAVEQQMQQLQQRDAQLNQSRNVLAQHYQSVLDHLNHLETQVRNLADRYHPAQPVNSANAVHAAEGGIAWPVTQEQALMAMQRQAQTRIGMLEGTLSQLAARPEGWPITRAAEITSHFGVRANPFGEDNYEFHKGLDFSAPLASPVWVTAPGVVVEAGQIGLNGNLVVVDHGYGFRTAYAHLSQIKVKIGDAVKAGQVVGLMGNTGRSTGPHLHYAVYHNGELVDPYPYVE